MHAANSLAGASPDLRPRWLRWLGAAHHVGVHGRRVRALASAIGPLVASDQSLLDVGCGDGRLTALLAQQNPGLRASGLDVLVRPGAAIDVQPFDGLHLPVPDKSVDCVLLVDVLHHADDPLALLAEAVRVARCGVVIKDHRQSRPAARATLRLMDWVGNRAHGVALPYNYWTMPQWHAAWRQLGVTPAHFQTRLGMYPWPAGWLFETGLHFLTRLTPPP